MATEAYNTTPEVRDLLSAIFPRWKGDASEPVSAPKAPRTPSPAARVLELA